LLCISTACAFLRKPREKLLKELASRLPGCLALHAWQGINGLELRQGLLNNLLPG
jgi:hypothetical protein